MSHKLEERFKRGVWSDNYVKIADPATRADMTELWDRLQELFPNMDKSKLQKKDVKKDADIMEFAHYHMQVNVYRVTFKKVLGCPCAFCRKVGRCRLTPC